MKKIKYMHCIRCLFLFLLLISSSFAQKNKIKKNTTTQLISIEALATIRIDTSFTVLPLFYEDKIFSFSKPYVITCTDITNKIIWRTELTGKIKFAPVITDNELIMSTSQGDLVIIDLTSGNQLQSIGMDENISTDLVKFKYSGSIELMIPKQTESMTALLLPGVSGKLFCLDAETLQEYWHNNDLKDIIYTKPIIVKDKIISSSKNGFIACLDSRSGLLIWKWKEKEETDFSRSAFISDGRNLYFTSNDSTLYSLDILLGKMNWKTVNRKVHPNIVLSEDNKNLITVSSPSKLSVMSAKDGKLIKEIKLNDNLKRSISIPLESQKKILLANKKMIYGIDEKYKVNTLMNFERGEILSFEKMNKNRFYVLTSEGIITIFRLR
jgi:outer membrane protein assembly factor BamB